MRLEAIRGFVAGGIRPRGLALIGGVLLGTLAAGCGGRSGEHSGSSPAVHAATANTVATGITVSCGPGQRAVIQPATANGQSVTDVRCLPDSAAGAAGVAAQGPAYTVDPAMVSPPIAPPYAGPVATTPVPVPLGAAAVPQSWTPVPTTPPQARPVAYRTDDDVLTYEPPRARRPVARRSASRRTWKKSAVIIGSSAGVGAGLGAAFGGKRGALIGAAVGGGAAAIWDQATRR